MSRLFQFVGAVVFMALMGVAVYAAARQLSKTSGGDAGTPTACGTGATVTGTDQAGVITTGTGVVTSCTVPFSQTYGGAPVCVVSAGATALTAGIASITPSSFMVGLSLSLPSGKIYYHCTMP